MRTLIEAMIMRFTITRGARLCFALLVLGLTTSWSGAAAAQEVVVVRDVTVREQPVRTAKRVDYPPVGTTLVLLDGGAQRRGYYHVRLPDGREGWVYRTYVRRESEAKLDATLLGPAGGRVAVHYIDVDQGGSAIVEFPCGAILIDAGGNGPLARDNLLGYLNRFFARRSDLAFRFDALFITHPHQDHNRYVREIVGEGGQAAPAPRYRFGAYVYNGKRHGVAESWMRERIARTPAIRAVPVMEADIAAEGTAGVEVGLKDAEKCGPTKPGIRVLSGGWPASLGWESEEKVNYHSLVIRVDYGDSSFLFTGDLEDEAIDRVVDRYQDTDMLDVDVYEAGHHGSSNGTNDRLLNATSPDIAVISVGHPELRGAMSAFGYGHPNAGLVSELEGRVTTTRRRPVAGFVGTRRRGPLVSRTVRKGVYATGWGDGNITVIGDPQGRIEVLIRQ